MEEKNKFSLRKFTNSSLIKRLSKVFIISFIMYIYSLVNAFQEVDPTQLSDRIVESLYFKGKKIYKISYDDLEKRYTKEQEKLKIKTDEEYKRYKNGTQISLENYNLNQQQKLLFFSAEVEAAGSAAHKRDLFKARTFYFESKYINKATTQEEASNNFFNKTNSEKNIFKNYDLIFDFGSINSHESIAADLFKEVIEEKLNALNSTEKEKNNFLFNFNLQSLYGNSTKLKLRSWDLVKLVENNILSNEQAYRFWFELIKINKLNLNPDFVKKSFSYITKTFYSLFLEKFYRENRIKETHTYAYSSINDEDPNDINFKGFKFSDLFSDDANNDVYIFNIFPTKSTACWIFASIMFIINYNVINYYNAKEKLSPVINFALLIFSLIMTENFYAWKIYLTSNIFLIQFIYSLKYFIFSLLNLVGYQADDFDIFSDFPKNNDSTQIILQSGTLSICTAVLGIFSFYRYNYIINYVFFYYCLLQLPAMFSVNFYNMVPVIFQPFRYFLILSLGLINFLIINNGKNKILNTNNPSNKLNIELNVDSYYVIGDLFTIFCFSYSFDYMFIQSNKISILFQESEHGGYINKDKLNEKITKIIKNYKELIREFEIEDCVWFICFNIGFFMQYTGLKFHKYLIYYFSYYFFRMVLGVYGRIFTIKCLKMTYSILIFIFLITNFMMSSKVDIKLFEALKLTNSDLTNLLRIFCRLFGVVNIIALILLNHEYLSIEINTIFIRKEPEISEGEELEENDEEIETNIAELLNDENFDKFLKECKIKFKDNLKNLYSLLNKERENGESINENELVEENEIDYSKYFPEEIDELIEERIKDKYFKNLARFLITSKLNKKKKKKQNLNYEDLENSCEDEENYEENEEEEEEVKPNRIKNENLKNEEMRIKFDNESIFNFFYHTVYYFIEIGLTYFTVCLLLLFIFQLEQNMFIIWAYYVLLITILARLLIVCGDYPYTFEFLIKYLITFLIGMRLQTLTIPSTVPYFIVNVFIFLLINMYSFNENRRFYLTIILVIFCYSTSFTINSLFSFIAIFIFIICPSITWNNKYLKMSISSILMVIPILVLFLTQKFDKQNSLDKFYEKVVLRIINFNENYLTIFKFNFLKFIQDTIHNQHIYEYDFIKYLLDYLIKLDL